MGVQLTHSELFEQSNALIADARALMESPDANAETHETVLKMIEDAKSLRARSRSLAELEAMAAEALPETPEVNPSGAESTHGFKSFGEYLQKIWRVTKYNEWDPRLKNAQVRFEDDPTPAFETKDQGWLETKAMSEAVGADGGFSVFPE